MSLIISSEIQLLQETSNFDVYLCDTDTIIDYMRASRDKTKPAFRKRMESECAKRRLFTSVINAGEILFGAQKADRINPPIESDKSKVNIAYTFLSHFEISDFGMSATEQYALIRDQLESDGLMIGANDVLIAAHCIQLGIPIVTGNIREFSRVSGLTVINLESFH